MPTSTNPVYRFSASNVQGLAGEARVIEHLEAHGFVVERVATLREQYEGIDCYASSPKTGERKRIEIKTDYRASVTGNAVVETVSNDQSGRAGWVHTTTADWLLYFVPHLDVLYWLRPADLRAALPRWLVECRAFAAQNVGYRTLGVLVPLHEFETLAASVVSL